MSRKRYLLVLAMVLVIGCGQAGGTGTQATPSAVIAPVLAGTNVISEGKLVPRVWVDLSSVVGGRAVRVLVKEGDQVTAGALLVELDDAQQRAALAQAEAALAGAQADLARLMAGAVAEEVAVAQAAVAAAQAGVAVAEQQALAAGSAPAVAAAQGALARAQLSDLVAGPRALDVEIAERSVALARNQLWGAQSVRDGVGGAVDRKQAKDYDLDQAEAAVGSAYESQIIAEKQLELLRSGARPGAVAAARASVQAADAQKAQAEAQQRVAESQVGTAQAAVQQAQAQLALAKASPREVDLARARAAIAQAEAAAESARVAVENTRLLAPIAGTVTAVDIETGELASPGVRLVQIADLTEWLVETDDLTEIEVVRVREGQAVKLAPDALPDLKWQGVVESVRAVSEVKRGDTTFTVRIKTEQPDPRLRWGMTVVATFED